ncbi:hypothetical protein N7462_010465 [Penicillium macrosclerotiorum]|uniref:uncharacterized protein n=1 Tax=Penicillium macrosclerotiorum TaxID=303699 RepID=UPI00254961FD|nr:uncharacterized protein N7462_010465 [Penicillium macrosclerotiorum]KAJ5669395.1 hypothetical protein N7462_010465 [Penicillium macrosclerotiorum]
MATSYANRAPASHTQTLPSFRELLPPHLHDEIDSSAYYTSRHQSQERPVSGHQMAADPRSIPGYPSNPPAEMTYREHPREYTTRTGEHPSRPMSDHLSTRISDSTSRGPSPSLPPIRDLGSMPDRQGYPDSRMAAPRSDPFAVQDYHPGQPGSMPGAMGDRRTAEPYGTPMMHAQPAYGAPAMAYASDVEQISAQMMTHPQQANFGIMGDPIDPKTKRRRGNLPKPVTDILRAWFHEHLDHPYPTEEDKQMFMTRTGLSISQISNWFINARRRHLPALRNQMRSGDHDSSRQSPFSDIDQELPSPRH